MANLREKLPSGQKTAAFCVGIFATIIPILLAAGVLSLLAALILMLLCISSYLAYEYRQIPQEMQLYSSFSELQASDLFIIMMHAFIAITIGIVSFPLISYAALLLAFIAYFTIAIPLIGFKIIRNSLDGNNKVRLKQRMGIYLFVVMSWGLAVIFGKSLGIPLQITWAIPVGMVMGVVCIIGLVLALTPLIRWLKGKNPYPEYDEIEIKKPLDIKEALQTILNKLKQFITELKPRTIFSVFTLILIMTAILLIIKNSAMPLAPILLAIAHLGCYLVYKWKYEDFSERTHNIGIIVALSFVMTLVAAVSGIYLFGVGIGLLLSPLGGFFIFAVGTTVIALRDNSTQLNQFQPQDLVDSSANHATPTKNKQLKTILSIDLFLMMGWGSIAIFANVVDKPAQVLQWGLPVGGVLGGIAVICLTYAVAPSIRKCCASIARFCSGKSGDESKALLGSNSNALAPPSQQNYQATSASEGGSLKGEDKEREQKNYFGGAYSPAITSGLGAGQSSSTATSAIAPSAGEYKRSSYQQGQT